MQINGTIELVVDAVDIEQAHIKYSISPIRPRPAIKHAAMDKEEFKSFERVLSKNYHKLVCSALIKAEADKYRVRFAIVKEGFKVYERK